jgi:hypothetical protein
LREFALLLVKRVEAVRAQVESRCNVQKVGCADTQFGGMVAR